MAVRKFWIALAAATALTQPGVQTLKAEEADSMLEINRTIAHQGCDWVYCWVRPILAVSGNKIVLSQQLLEIGHPDCFS